MKDFLCIKCHKRVALDGSYLTDEGRICEDCYTGKPEASDISNRFNQEKKAISEYCAQIILQNKYTAKQEEAFLTGIQAGYGLAVAIYTDTLETFLGTLNKKGKNEKN